MHQQQQSPVQTRPVIDPYRSLGSIVSGPVHLQTSPTFAIICPTFSSYKIYTSTLSLQNISPNFSHPVSAIIGDGDKVYLRCGSYIYKMNYYHILREWYLAPQNNHQQTSRLMKIGEAIILLEEQNVAVFLDSRQQGDDPVKVFRLGFKAQGIAHPQTYVNKIVMFGDSCLELWNFARGERIFNFTDYLQKIVGKEDHILAVEPSPACDILCISYSSGRILMYNIKTNKLVFELKQKKGAVSLAFSQNAKPLLATGDTKGSIIFWDLDEKRILSKLEETHGRNPVDSLVFLPNELLLISASSADNSLKQWKYDQIEQLHFRLLRQRCSISEDIQDFRIQSNQELVINTQNQTCYLSLLSENNTYLLPKCLDSRLPTHIAAAKGHYLNVYKNQTVIKTIPIGERPVVGRISMSQSFFVVATPTKLLRVGSGDTLTWNIAGVKSIAFYQQHYIYALTNSALYVLDFCNSEVAPQIFEVSEEYSPLFLIENDLGNFAALAYEKMVEVWDMKNCRKGRSFYSMAASEDIQTVCFSPDNRYLLVGGGQVVQVFDIISSTLQKSIQLQKRAAHIQITPDNNFLISAFEGSREVNLWHNLIGIVASSVDLESINFATVISRRDEDLRKYLNKETQAIKKEESTQDNYNQFDLDGYLDDIPDAQDGLTSFTALPVSRWMPLAYYDEIKERNRPKVNLEKKIEAPFFLDFKKKDEIVKNLQKETQAEIRKQSRILNDKADELLRDAHRAIDFEDYSSYEGLLETLKKLTPAEFDYEVRSYLLLPTNAPNIIKFTKYLLQNSEEFDLKIVYAYRCLSVMGTDILQGELRQELKELKARIQNHWNKVYREMNLCGAVITKLSSNTTQ